jgi:THO complex subunit 2 N-terminus
LIREESEGYLTLFTVLHSPQKSQALDIIGTYDLDPNRTMDLILTVFEKNTWDLTFIDLLLQLKTKVLPHILGFKFQNTLDKCKSLCEVAAHCIRLELLTIDSLWGYLKPEDFYKSYQEHENLVQSVKRSLDVVVINSDNSTKDKDLNKLMQNDNNNQKLGLLTQLIKLNYWDKVKEVLNRFEGKIVLCSYPDLIEALCQMLEWVIDPVYQDLPKPLPTTNKTLMFPPGSLVQLTCASQLQPFFLEILPIIGVYIGYSDDTYDKVCKCLQHCEDKKFVLAMLNKYIIPALSLAGSNIVKSLWTAIQDFNYQLRYEMYLSWKKYNKGLIIVKQSLTVSIQVDQRNKSMDQEAFS